MKEAKRIKIKIFGLLALLVLTSAQLSAQDYKRSLQAPHLNLIKKKFDFQLSNTIILPSKSFTYKAAENSIKMPSSYDFEQLAIFCRLEEAVAKKSNINMRFRLGSLEYVDRLEQKPYTNKLHQ